MSIKIKTPLLICLVLLAEQGKSQTKKLFSPDGKVGVVLTAGQNLQSLVTYTVSYSAAPVTKNAVVGLDVAGIQSLHVTAGKSERKNVSTAWRTVYGERKIIAENYNELRFYFTSLQLPDLQISVTCRAYNEGFAFNYQLVQKNKTIVLKRELSMFPLNDSATAWVSSTAQGIVSEKKINYIKDVVERPLTVKLNDHLFAALGEACLVDFARMKFSSVGNGKLLTELQGEVIATDTMRSPWRYILLGNSPSALLQKDYLLLNLNEPNKIKNTAWIKPGKVLREVTLTTVGSFETIDFAAKHNIKYICFDAGWYGREDRDTSDATHVAVDPARSKGPLDLKKVIEYGKQKNVGVILYVNRRALERQLDTLLPLYHSWGVKGLKFGFVQVGSQKWTSWLHEAIRKSAKYEMLVDVHDEYRPTGYSRTYPNLLTQEGIRGDEESPGIEHTITTLFTRMLAGAADNTNCYFTGRVNKMGSHVAQLAKAVCIYSPFQFLYWYDKPVSNSSKTGKEGEILEVPELGWYNTLPTVWDDTKVLEGTMQSYATIARKRNNEWYIGSLNGDSARTVNWPCSFLDQNKKYVATIYTDDAAVNTPTKVKVTTMNIDYRSVIKLPVAARNGIAIRIVLK